MLSTTVRAGYSPYNSSKASMLFSMLDSLGAARKLNRIGIRFSSSALTIVLGSTSSPRAYLSVSSIKIPVWIEKDRDTWVNASESADMYSVGTRDRTAWVKARADLPVPGPAQIRHSCPRRNTILYLSKDGNTVGSGSPAAPLILRA